jgi:hypothetical protein
VTNLCPTCQLPLDPYDVCVICAAMERVRAARAVLIKQRWVQGMARRNWKSKAVARLPHKN